MLQTPTPEAGPEPEFREFETGRTRVQSTAAASSKMPKGFGGMTLVEFAGQFEFEVTPRPLVPGAPFRVRIFIKNDSKSDAKLDALTVKIARNRAVTSPSVRILEDNLKVGQRPLVAEISGTWVADTTSWVMDVQATSKQNERYNASLTMK